MLIQSTVLCAKTQTSKSRFNNAMKILAESHNAREEKEKQLLKESSTMNLDAFKRNKTPTQVAVEKRNRVKQFKLETVVAFVTSAILEACVDKEIVGTKTEEVLVTSEKAVSKLSSDGTLDISNMSESVFTKKLMMNINEFAEYKYNLEKHLVEQDTNLENLLIANINEALEVTTANVRESVVTLFMEHQDHIIKIDALSEGKYLTGHQKTAVKQQSVFESLIQSNLGLDEIKLAEGTEDLDAALTEAKFTAVVQYAFLECLNQLNLVSNFDRNSFLNTIK
jgi:hypothetical protein